MRNHLIIPDNWLRQEGFGSKDFKGIKKMKTCIDKSQKDEFPILKESLQNSGNSLILLNQLSTPRKLRFPVSKA
jgi:hypothetical protein